LEAYFCSLSPAVVLKLKLKDNRKVIKMINIHQQITFLPTTCMQQVERFYQGVLKLEKILEQEDCVIFKSAESAYIGFCRRQATQDPDRILLTLVTDHVDAFYQQLADQGIECEGKPVLNEKYKIYHFFVKDPNGYRVEIQKFLNPFDGR
jgi:catechol 2,3-dioxygenase-like lactoylglutathione lyase family enzyme